jgi:hypothetical protein
VTPLYPQKLALTSPTGGGRSVGIVRVRTKATEFCLFVLRYHLSWKKDKCVPIHAIESYVGRGVISPHIFSHGVRWRWVVILTPRLQERATGIHWIGGWLGLRAGLEVLEQGIISCAWRDSNPRSSSLHPVTKLYVAGPIWNPQSTPLMNRIYVQRVDVSDCGLLEKHHSFFVRWLSGQPCVLLHVISFDPAFTNGGLTLHWTGKYYVLLWIKRDI